jgi:hypothetical protein
VTGKLRVVALLGVVALALAGPGLATAACQQWTGAEPPSPGSGDDGLNGVAILGPCNVWAVGDTENPGVAPLIEHWDGRAWRVVAAPNPGSPSRLNDVSPSWAVGSYNVSGTKTLILRRVGNSWAQVTSPSPESSNELQGVAQISSGNGWAAGYVLNGTAYRTLILHWNGTAWKRVQSPNTGDSSTDNMLFGIAAHGADDIWAVGQREEGSGTQPLTLHWNGSKWRVASAPTLGDAPFGSSLVDVDIDPMHAWAVGSYASGTSLKGFILRRDGTTWKRVKLPSFPAGTVIEGVKAVSPRNVWAVGEENTKNLLLHWNGRSWKKVPVASPGAVENIFYDIDALSSNEIWAVGQSRDAGGGIYEARAMHCC